MAEEASAKRRVRFIILGAPIFVGKLSAQQTPVEKPPRFSATPAAFQAKETRCRTVTMEKGTPWDA